MRRKILRCLRDESEKGIPVCLREFVWQLIFCNRELVLMSPDAYEKLVMYQQSASELEIIRDISRTFPYHVFFQQRHGPGQRSLYNVLRAYSVYDREVGYVQVPSPTENEMDLSGWSELLHTFTELLEQASPSTHSPLQDTGCT